MGAVLHLNLGSYMRIPQPKFLPDQVVKFRTDLCRQPGWHIGTILIASFHFHRLGHRWSYRVVDKNIRERNSFAPNGYVLLEKDIKRLPKKES